MRIVLFFLVLGSVACKERRAAAPAVGFDASVTAPADAVAPVAPPRARIDEAAARALLDAWLAAQNGRDFAAYEALYAERFGGIKRVGPRTYRFDRKGWLADRTRMFRSSMTVTADNLQIAAMGGIAVLRFRQTYEQGRFQDVGDKQLVLVETPAGPRISREEMLRSTVVGGPGSAQATAMPILHDGDPWLVIGDASDVIATGPATLGAGGRGFEFSARQEAAGVAAEWIKRIGAPVTMYPSGGHCSIGGYRVLHLLTPHFTTTAEWSGDEDGDGTPEGQPLTGPALAAAVVAAGGAAHLVAELVDCTGAIGGDLLGVLGSGTATLWFSVDDDALAGRVAQAFHTHAEFQAIQLEYAQTYGGQGLWSQTDPGEEGVTLWRAPTGDGRVAIAAARAGEGCGDFGASLAIAFDVAPDGTLTPLGAVPVDDDLPTFALDSNGDGRPELVAPATIWSWDGEAYAPVHDLDLGFRDCGC